MRHRESEQRWRGVACALTMLSKVKDFCFPRQKKKESARRKKECSEVLYPSIFCRQTQRIRWGIVLWLQTLSS